MTYQCEACGNHFRGGGGFGGLKRCSICVVSLCSGCATVHACELADETLKFIATFVDKDDIPPQVRRAMIKSGWSL